MSKFLYHEEKKGWYEEKFIKNICDWIEIREKTKKHPLNNKIHGLECRDLYKHS